MNWWMIVAISAVTATYVQADTSTCAQCISAYGSSAQSCTEATTYSTCANAATTAGCTDAEKATATKAVSDKCTDGATDCDKCKATYDDSTKTCAVAETYVTCLDGANDACGSTTMVDTKTAAAKKKEEYCSTCNKCSTTYNTDVAATGANKCTVADTYVTCLNGVKDDCGPITLVKTKAAAATKKVEFCTTDCDKYKATYDGSTKTCAVAETYVTCLDGANDACGSTTLVDTKTAAAKKKEEYCNSAGSLTVSMVFTSLMMAVVSLVRE